MCDTSAMSDLAGLADRLAAAAADVAALSDSLEAGEPWPLVAEYGPGPESSWGPREVLAHVGEMLPYWMGEIERILDGRDADAVPFGRTEADPVRIALIGRDRTMPVRELLSRIASEARRIEARLRELPPAAAAREGLHATRGPITVVEVVERFQVGHLEGHVEQMREILGASSR